MVMQHTLQDAIDTAARRTSEPRSPWHPIMAARETEPGTWYMVDSLDKCYGIIRIIRRGGEVGYRAVTWAASAADRQLIGYYRSLRGACEATHQRLIASVTPGGPVNGR